MTAKGSAVDAGAVRLHPLRRAAAEVAQAEQREPVRLLLPWQQLTRTLVCATDPAAHDAPVIQGELLQAKVRAPKVARQREIRAQPRVQVLHQQALARRVRRRARHGVEDEMKLVRQFATQPVPALPVCGRTARPAMQQAHLAHKRLSHVMRLGDAHPFAVEHAGEREQGVALVVRRDPHRAHATHVLMPSFVQLGRDEVEHRLAHGHLGPGQRQHVVAQPMAERAHVARQRLRPGRLLARTIELLGQNWFTKISR